MNFLKRFLIIFLILLVLYCSGACQIKEPVEPAQPPTPTCGP